jgi:hypothetical protein
MVSLPSGFRYQGVDWVIVEDVVSLRESGRYAQTDYRRQAVSVDPTWTDAHARQSLLHELMHVVEMGALDERGLTTEHIIHLISIGLFGVLSDNPCLRRFIWPDAAD